MNKKIQGLALGSWSDWNGNIEKALQEKEN